MTPAVELTVVPSSEMDRPPSDGRGMNRLTTAAIVLGALVLLVTLYGLRWVAVEHAAGGNCIARQSESFRGTVHHHVSFPFQQVTCTTDPYEPTRNETRRTPALEIPAGVTPCRADDLAIAAGSDLVLIRLFNLSDKACGLAGHVTLFGRDAAGTWQPVPTTPLSKAAVDGGEGWTGIFDPALTAVFSVRPSGDGSCADADARAHYTALRVVLPGEAGSLDMDPFEFDTGPCPLEVTAIAGDSGDF